MPCHAEQGKKASARSQPARRQATCEANRTWTTWKRPQILLPLSPCAPLTFPVVSPRIHPSCTHASTHPSILPLSNPQPSTAHPPTTIHMPQNHAPCTLPATAFGGGRAGGIKTGENPSLCSTSPLHLHSPLNGPTGQGRAKKKTRWPTGWISRHKKMRTRSNGLHGPTGQFLFWHCHLAPDPPDKPFPPARFSPPPMARVGRPALEYELPLCAHEKKSRAWRNGGALGNWLLLHSRVGGRWDLLGLVSRLVECAAHTPHTTAQSKV